MNKRSISRLASLILMMELVCALCGCAMQDSRGGEREEPSGAVSLKSYNDAIDVALRDMVTQTDAYGYGLVCDVDQNGIDDLILLYEAEINSEIYWVCSLFSIHDGEVVTLLYEQPLGKKRLSTYSMVAAGEIDGKLCLAVFWEYIDSSEGDGTGYQESRWYLYQYQNANFLLDTTVEYKRNEERINHVTWQVHSSTCINGEIKDDAEYEAWLNRIGVFDALDTDGFRQSDSAFSLTDSDAVAAALARSDSWWYKLYSTDVLQSAIDLYFGLPATFQFIFLLILLVPIVLIGKGVHSCITSKARKQYARYTNCCEEDLPDKYTKPSYFFCDKPQQLKQRANALFLFVLITFVLLFVMLWTYCVAEAAPAIIGNTEKESELLQVAIEIFIIPLVGIVLAVIGSVAVAAVVFIIKAVCQKIYTRPINIRVTRYRKRERKDD